MPEIVFQREVFMDAVSDLYLADLDSRGIKVLSDICDLRWSQHRNKEAASSGQLLGQILAAAGYPSSVEESWFTCDGRKAILHSDYSSNPSITWTIKVRCNGRGPWEEDEESTDIFNVLELGVNLADLEQDSTMEQVADYIQERVLPPVNHCVEQIVAAIDDPDWDPQARPATMFIHKYKKPSLGRD